MKRAKYPKVKKRFKELREELNTMEKDCTQDMLAKEIGVQKPQISELENGKRLPSINELIAYSRYFKAPMEYLLGITDNRHHENINAGSELGLSDEVITALKLWIEKSPKCNIISILNQIFKIGYGYTFFNALSHYFYGECSGMFTANGFSLYAEDNIQAMGNDISKIISINKKDIEYIFQHKLYDLLAEIKKELKEKNFECTSELYNGFDSNACLSEFYNNLDETISDKDFTKYLNKIRRNENG